MPLLIASLVALFTALVAFCVRLFNASRAGLSQLVAVSLDRLFGELGRTVAQFTPVMPSGPAGSFSKRISGNGASMSLPPSMARLNVTVPPEITTSSTCNFLPGLDSVGAGAGVSAGFRHIGGTAAGECFEVFLDALEIAAARAELERDFRRFDADGFHHHLVGKIDPGEIETLASQRLMAFVVL